MSLLSGASLLVFGLWLDRGPFPLAYQIVFLLSFAAALLNLYYFWRRRRAALRAVPATTHPCA